MEDRRLTESQIQWLFMCSSDGHIKLLPRKEGAPWIRPGKPSLLGGKWRKGFGEGLVLQTTLCTAYVPINGPPWHHPWPFRGRYGSPRSGFWLGLKIRLSRLVRRCLPRVTWSCPHRHGCGALLRCRSNQKWEAIPRHSMYAIYADQLGWCQRGQWGGSPMAVPWSVWDLHGPDLTQYRK